MSYIRAFLPDTINNILGYYHGMCLEYLNYYLPTSKYKLYHIIDNIYLSNLASAVKKNELQNDNITHIISVFNGSFELYPDNFTYKLIHINDDPWEKINIHFDDCYNFINNTNNNVLVHCIHGISRSCSIIIYYIMRKYNKTYEEALNYLKEKKYNVNPNNGFVKQLSELKTN